MTVKDKHHSGISIQVGLSGYSFIRDTEGESRYSGWMSAERFFTSPELQQRYDEVEIGVFTHKFTLVPTHFHTPSQSRAILGDVVSLQDTDTVGYVEVPEFASVLVFSNSIGETLSKVISQSVLRTDGASAGCLPYIYYMLKSVPTMTEYNKIAASYMDGYLYLVIAQGRSLLLCNAFVAPDFTTAEYFIFMALKKLQLNPEISSITFMTPLEQEQEMSLYRYFRNVEVKPETALSL